MFSFTVQKILGQARLSELTTPHGKITGPFFQFVATQAAIRGMVFSEDLEAMGVQIVLANTYHLHLQPGESVIAEAGGLHGFMQWPHPITTDSGGYQIFSLGQNVKLDPDGVTFRSPRDGSEHRLTPEKAIQIQKKLGADIIMPLDVCTPYGASHDDVSRAVDQTTNWARRCYNSFCSPSPYEGEGGGEVMARQMLYGIIQGSLYPDLRERSATQLKEIPFFGYSVGGELREGAAKQIVDGLRMTVPHLPAEKPRYLMGVGEPEDIIEAVRQGIDQFDCVLPIRNARHGKLYYNLNTTELERALREPDYPIAPEKLYATIDIRRPVFKNDQSLFSPDHPVITKAYAKAYVHHLMRTEAPSGLRLAVLHNIYFYEQLMQTIHATLKTYGV